MTTKLAKFVDPRLTKLWAIIWKKMDVWNIIILIAAAATLYATFRKEGNANDDRLRDKDDIINAQRELGNAQQDLANTQRDYQEEITKVQREYDSLDADRALKLSQQAADYAALNAKYNSDLNSAQLRLELHAAESENKILAAQQEAKIALLEATGKATALIAFMDLHQVIVEIISEFKRYDFEELETTKVKQRFTELNQNLTGAMQIVRIADPRHTDYDSVMNGISNAISAHQEQYVKCLEEFKKFDPKDEFRPIAQWSCLRENEIHYHNINRQLGNLYESFRNSVRQ